MSYLDELRMFETWTTVNSVSSSVQFDWWKLHQVANNAYWPEWLSLSNSRLQDIFDLKGTSNIYNHLDNLESLGLIEVIKGKRNEAKKIKLVPMKSLISGTNNNLLPKKETKTGTKSGTNPRTKSELTREHI